MLSLALCQRRKTHVNYKTHKIYFTTLDVREDIFLLFGVESAFEGETETGA